LTEEFRNIYTKFKYLVATELGQEIMDKHRTGGFFTEKPSNKIDSLSSDHNLPANTFSSIPCVNRSHRRLTAMTFIRSRTRKSALTRRTIL